MSDSASRDRRDGDSVASPCISVCTVLQPAGICLGCFRTLEEIAQWSVQDAAGKRAVLAALPARRAAQLDPIEALRQEK